jgi:hypothetical protein
MVLRVLISGMSKWGRAGDVGGVYNFVFLQVDFSLFEAFDVNTRV